MTCPASSNAVKEAKGSVPFSGYRTDLGPVMCTGSCTLVTLTVTSMLSEAPEGSVAVTTTLYLFLASKFREAFVISWPVFLDMSKNAASAPLSL